MDPITVAGVVGGLKKARDIAELLLSFKDKTELRSKVSEMQKAITAALDEHSALLKENRRLEEEVRDLKAHKTERERYERKQTAAGHFTYTLKPNGEVTGPAHHLCTTCFENDHLSTLQPLGDNGTALKCHVCKSVIRLMPDAPQEPHRGSYLTVRD